MKNKINFTVNQIMCDRQLFEKEFNFAIKNFRGIYEFNIYGSAGLIEAIKEMFLKHLDLLYESVNGFGIYYTSYEMCGTYKLHFIYAPDLLFDEWKIEPTKPKVTTYRKRSVFAKYLGNEKYLNIWLGYGGANNCLVSQKDLDDLIECLWNIKKKIDK